MFLLVNPVNMSKSRAALTHIWPTLLVLGLITGLVLFVWYPYPFRQFGESGKFALLLIFSAAFTGPFLTWLVYSKGKRGLVLDLWIIALIQLAAIAWGTFSLYQNRPFFLVFTVDRFEVLSKRDVDLSWITEPKFLDKPFVGPILLYANMPSDPAAYQKFLNEVMFEGKPDLQFRPEYWSLYAERQQLVLHESRSLEALLEARLDSSHEIDKLVKDNGGDIHQLQFVPAMLKNGPFAVILNAQTGKVIDTLVIDPWLK